MALRQSVRMSATKGDLYRALNLQIDDGWHARLYSIMNKEVEVYWKALVADRGHRVPAAQNKPGPYSYHDFHLEAIEVAVRLATENASEETAPLLQSGPDDKGDSYWVARWCLYHLCRNRDGRNGRPNTGSRTQTAGGHSDLAAA